MIKIRFNGWIIACCLLSSPLFSCPSNLNIQAVLDEGNPHQLSLAVEALTKCAKWQDSLGLVYHKLGLLHYDRGRGNIDSAIFYAEKAREVREKVYKKTPHLDLGKSYHNLGVYYRAEGEFLLAKPVFKRAVSVFKNLKERKRLRRSQLELGIIFSLLGDYQKSETIYRLLLDDGRADEDRSKIKALLNLGKMYNDQGKFEMAMQVLKQSIQIADEDDYSKDLAASYHNIGLAYYSLKNYEQAINYYKKAMTIYQYFEDCAETAKIQNNLGLAFLKNNKSSTAKEFFEIALKQALLCENNEIIALSYDNLGEYYLSIQQTQDASMAFSKALQTLVPLLSETGKLDKKMKEVLEQSSFKIDLLVYLSDKIRALKTLYTNGNGDEQLLKTMKYLEIGDYLIDQLRQKHNDQSTKLFWRQEVLPFYEKAIETCTLLDKPDEAFFYFEKSKSILLLEALLSSNALQSIPDSSRREVKYLERHIRLQRESLQQAKDKNKAQTLKKILKLEAQLDSLNESLTQQYPQLKALRKNNLVIDLKRFRQVYLQEKQRTLVHYFFGKDNVYALVVSEHKKQLINLGKSEQLTLLIRNYLQYFEHANHIESQPTSYLQQAEKVYAALIKPLNLPTETALLIIPAGILTYLPFEALITENADQFNIANAPYMLLKHKLWYGFSATMFDQIEQRHSALSPKSLLAFAPFAHESSPDYPVLNFSEDELSSISYFVSIDLYMDKQAELDIFLNHQSDYSIIHLSTHAFSSFSTTQPFIVFADKVLHLADLYQHHIPANLVVLSACQTQIGKLAPGEGVLGLNRGFFYAGARSVVSSLWNMKAKSTANILANFYQLMADGTPKFMALHQAKTNYLQNENIPGFQKSPYYWAAMNYYGDSEQWAVNPSVKWWKYTLPLLFFIGFGGWFWKNKK